MEGELFPTAFIPASGSLVFVDMLLTGLETLRRHNIHITGDLIGHLRFKFHIG